MHFYSYFSNADSDSTVAANGRPAAARAAVSIAADVGTAIQIEENDVGNDTNRPQSGVLRRRHLSSLIISDGFPLANGRRVQRKKTSRDHGCRITGGEQGSWDMN